MKLAELVTHYTAFKRALGMRFNTEARVLTAFCRAMGDIDIAEVTAEAVLAYIAGDGPVTSFWHHKFQVLNGFYRFAISRGYTDVWPLPSALPKCPPSPTPYIYTVEELRRLLAATDHLANPAGPLQAVTFRTLLLVLYGTGLRIGEALALTLNDVQLDEQLLIVPDSKCFKTRLVPMGPRLTAHLSAYLDRRHQLPRPAGDASACFATRTGQRLCYSRVQRVFQRLRRLANIQRDDGARYQPRLHDIRHTAATHRVQAWYREGIDVQLLLPHLATYLGHVDLRHTQRYLTLTPELLNAASSRFEQYAGLEEDHDT